MRGGAVAGGVFISYRGADAGSYAALLYVGLSRRFGGDLVFMDCESIPAGADFVDQLLLRVRGARALLVVIGPSWLTAGDVGGRRRMEDPADWIRRELVEAFAAGVRVIPVLTDGAQLPAEADLPAELGGLLRCQFRRLRYRDVTADLNRLCSDLTVADAVPARRGWRRNRSGLAGVVGRHRPLRVSWPRVAHGESGGLVHLERRQQWGSDGVFVR